MGRAFSQGMTVRRLKFVFAASALGLVLGAACSSNSDDGDGDSDFIDNDGDGFSEADGDCNDLNRSIYPGAPDPCDGIDQNCDGTPDEAFDIDGDGWTTCGGDCRDNDATSNPGATEIVDGLDNDCDGIADNHTDQYDDDGDGFSEDQGDCNDDPNAGGSLIGPGAIEVAINEDGDPEGIDNDCDGVVDEALEPCPAAIDKDDASHLASSMDVCFGLLSARFDSALGIDARSRNIVPQYGDTYVPRLGDDMIVLSSGLAVDSSDASWVAPQSGTTFANSPPHPDPQGAMGCSDADSASVNDLSMVELVLQVPTNAKSFSFDFNFMSAEFPEYVCTLFDDTFLAMLESEAFTGNISFDSMGNRVSINVGFFDVCSPGLDPVCSSDADLLGTGYEGNIGGGTGWLTTTAPVVPGEKIRLKFIIFDEGDHILDSLVLIDNFRWEIEPVDGPVTVD